ncbi:iron-sulfur assembly protein 2 [Podospora conica]|nr:iron-sulfur assembly protein 2 [Schizothecium conicum]
MPPRPCLNPPSPASLFIQLSMRRHAAAAGTPLLDLLVPTARTYTTRTTTKTTARPSLFPPRTPQRPLPLQRRPLSTSHPRLATHAIFNPQIDEEGKEMMLEITARAAKRLNEIMTKDSNPHLALRIQVESGGCHGFQYLMKLVTLPADLPTEESLAASTEEGDGDSVSETGIRSDDTILAWAQDGSEAGAEAGSPSLTAPKIILDGPSLELLKGSKVDFTMELIGSQFKIVDNPLATSSCGCGTSFDIKV